MMSLAEGMWIILAALPDNLSAASSGDELIIGETRVQLDRRRNGASPYTDNYHQVVVCRVLQPWAWVRVLRRARAISRRILGSSDY